MKKQKINSFEAACKKLGIDPLQLPGVSHLPEKYQLKPVADYKLAIIIEALNDGWKPDYSNYSQYKYYPWMKFVPGVGWSYNDCDYSNVYSAVGSRFVFKDVKTCKYAVETFPELYNAHFSLD